MRFTERDDRLLHWINGHGFVTLRQAAKWLGTNYQTAQRRVRLLYDHGYLNRQWLVHGDRAHWLTPAGRAMCGDSLPPPKHIRLGSYRHDRLLVDLAWLRGNASTENILSSESQSDCRQCSGDRVNLILLRETWPQLRCECAQMDRELAGRHLPSRCNPPEQPTLSQEICRHPDLGKPERRR